MSPECDCFPPQYRVQVVASYQVVVLLGFCFACAVFVGMRMHNHLSPQELQVLIEFTIVMVRNRACM